MTGHAHHHAPQAEPDSQRWLKMLAIGSALTLGAVIVAPYVLPALGVGSAELAERSMLALHGEGLGTGLAGAINGVLNAVPGIGPTIAGGGFAAAAATGVIGIGGVLLGRYLEARDDGKRHIRWGKVITTAALLTSALIAMPSLLTGISVGIIYLCNVISGASLASTAITFLGKTLGSTGTASMAVSGVSGAALTLPHLLTCGSSILPLCISWALGRTKKAATPEGETVAGQVHADMPAEAGKLCNLTVRLYDKRSGSPLDADMLAVVHTQKLHLLVVDESLSDYQHIHPQPTGVPGEYACSFTPQTANRYSAWADFTLMKDSENHRLKMDVPSLARRKVTPSVQLNTHADVNGLHCAWNADEALQNGKPSMVTITVADALGNPVSDLEPLMGAYAHLVGFSADGKSLVHTHPLGAEPQNPADRGAGRLQFHIEPHCEGAVQFYLQIKRGGQEVFVPFGQEISRQTAFAARIGRQRQQGALPAHVH